MDASFLDKLNCIFLKLDQRKGRYISYIDMIYIYIHSISYTIYYYIHIKKAFLQQDIEPGAGQPRILTSHFLLSRSQGADVPGICLVFMEMGVPQIIHN